MRRRSAAYFRSRSASTRAGPDFCSHGCDGGCDGGCGCGTVVPARRDMVAVAAVCDHVSRPHSSPSARRVTTTSSRPRIAAVCRIAVEGTTSLNNAEFHKNIGTKQQFFTLLRRPHFRLLSLAKNHFQLVISAISLFSFLHSFFLRLTPRCRLGCNARKNGFCHYATCFTLRAFIFPLLRALQDDCKSLPSLMLLAYRVFYPLPQVI